MPEGPLARLLIVDDEAAQMRALRNTLNGQGYVSTGYTSAREALTAIHPGEFDLLLTDLMMPEMDGIALLRAALEVDADLVAIMMTGHGTIGTAVEAMKVGALDYILKPFKLSSILPVLARALAVRRLRRENAELARRVDERTAELESANRELEAFSYSVAHDLRAPLRSIDAFANVLLEDFAAMWPEEPQRLLRIVSGSARRMEQLIDGLLRLSHLGRQQLSRQPVPVGPLVERVLDDLRAAQPERRVVTCVGDLPDTVGDPSLLHQVFANLLANAFKFTRGVETATILVASREQDGEKVYFVQDNGAGFDMQFAATLFGVFQRLHSEEDYEGTGVGLSIVQRIIERHGGRIWAEAEVGKGATFLFTLP